MAKSDYKLRHVCPSFRMEQLCSHWTDFVKFGVLGIFRKSVEKIQVLLKSDKNNGHFKWRPIYICDYISLICSQNEKCFKQKEKKDPTDDTSIDVHSQQVNLTCFMHHYAHRQENRLYKTASVVSLGMLAAVVWSQ